MSTDRKTTVLVPDVCCAAEEISVRNAFKRVEGVDSLSFDLPNRTISIRHSGDTEIILETLRRSGFPGRLMSQTGPVKQPDDRRHLWTVVVALALLSAGLLVSWLNGPGTLPALLFLGSMLTGGGEVVRRAARTLSAFRLDVNVLMSAAAVGAVILGDYAEGAAVLTLYGLSILLESKSIDRTRRAIGELLSLRPDTVRLLAEDGERPEDIAAVGPGSRILVRPGERIPLDGRVVHGETSVDESALTGESLPVYKGERAQVFAGTLNGHGAIEVEVTAGSEATMLHTITELVEEARRKKDSVQTFMERFARWYVPGVFVAAILVAFIPPVLLAGSMTDWFYRALTLLVISCPCALLLSAPMAVVSAITASARHGILIRSGEVLERLSQVKAVAVDKTGTITQGFHDVTRVIPLNGEGEDSIVRLAAALESRSEHPLARAILRFARTRGVPADARIEAFSSVPGKGVRGRIAGRTYLIGNHAFIEDHGICSPQLEARIGELESGGETVLVLASEASPIGLIAARDSARSDAGTAIRQIAEFTGRPVTILTGDNKAVGEALGREIGAGSVRSGLLPKDKTEEVERLTRDMGPVAMVGDGVNDAPALAAAHVGIAIGASGSDTAIDASDVVLLSPSLRAVGPVLQLGRSAHRIIRFNIILALLTKAVFLLLGVAGLSSLWLAILADDGVTLVVLLNSLRLLGFDPTKVSSGP